MIQPTLLFGATLAALCAGIYFYVGRVLSRRHQTSPGAAMAWSMLVVWWYALAAATLSGALLSLLGALGSIGIALFTTMTLMNLLTTCVALFGLMYYLLYLFTGSSRVLWPLAVFYIVYYNLLVYYIEARNPVSVTVNRWSASLEFQNLIQAPLFYIALILLVFPQILGSM